MGKSIEQRLAEILDEVQTNRQVLRPTLKRIEHNTAVTFQGEFSA
jgi:hypothetical protein